MFAIQRGATTVTIPSPSHVAMSATTGQITMTAVDCSDIAIIKVYLV